MKTYGPQDDLKGKPLALPDNAIFEAGCNIIGTAITTDNPAGGSFSLEFRPGCIRDDSTTIDGRAV